MTAQLITSDPMSQQNPVAQVVAVSKTYGRGAEPVHALRDVTAAFAPGTFTAVMGPSGSGKSTLLHVRRRPRPADVRGRADRRHRPRRHVGEGPHQAAPRPDRLHLPGVQPDARRSTSRRTSACRPAWPAPAWTGVAGRGCSTASGSTGGCAIAPASSPAVSSSGWPSPGPSRCAPRSSSRTSRPARWTPGPAARSSSSCASAVDRRRPHDRHGHPRPARRGPRRQRAVPGRRPDRRPPRRARPPTPSPTRMTHLEG